MTVFSNYLELYCLIFFFNKKVFLYHWTNKIKSAGNRRTMGGGVNIWKQITFHSVQRSYRRGLCINILVLPKLLHEAALLPASLAAAVSDHPLSASSKAVKTARQFCLVPEAENCIHAFTPMASWRKGRKAPHRTCCLYISETKAKYYSWTFFPDSPKPLSGASRHLPVPTQSYQPS